jgi:hypothetical protein
MAAVDGRPGNVQKLSWYLNHNAHQLWDRFSPDQQDEMVGDDLSAGISVSMVLVSLITTGMLLCIATLVAVLASS